MLKKNKSIFRIMNCHLLLFFDCLFFLMRKIMTEISDLQMIFDLTFFTQESQNQTRNTHAQNTFPSLDVFDFYWLT